MKFYIIIPVHNRLKYTLSCLESLQGQTEENWDKEIIIIDDGSTDETYDFIKKRHPEITILNGDGTLWFTGSVNLGLEYVLNRAKSKDYVLIINNDTILDNNYFVSLRNSIEKYPNTLIGNVLLDIKDKQTIIDGGIYYHKFKNKFYSFNYGHKITEFNNSYVQKSELLPTRGLAIPLSVINEVGLFDAKNFPQRASDYDFTLRASEKDYRLIVDYSCRIYSENDFGYTPLNNRMSFIQFIRSFNDRKSSYHLKTFLNFGVKHFRKYKLFIPVYFFRLLLGPMKLYIISLGKRRRF